MPAEGQAALSQSLSSCGGDPNDANVMPYRFVTFVPGITTTGRLRRDVGIHDLLTVFPCLLSIVLTVELYARVSTHDKGQDPEVQMRELRNQATHRGWTSIREYVDVASGAREERPALNQLIADMKRGLIQVVLVVRLDRLNRSLKHLVNLLADFNDRKVALISLMEGLDFTTSTGQLLFHVIAVLAEFECDLISDRVKVAWPSQKQEEVKIGRPSSTTPALIARVRDLHRDGKSLRVISRSVAVSRSLAHKIIRRVS